jgi:hypothetical protein
MTTTPHWMTDDYLREQLRDSHAGPIAAEVLRLRADLREAKACSEGWKKAAEENMLDRNRLATELAEIRGVLPMRLDDGRLLAVDSIAGGAHPDAQPDGFPAELTLAMGGLRCRYGRMDTAQRKAAMNQQRFSLGTKFHDAVRDASAVARINGDSGTFALLRAVGALGAAVEREMSRRP